MKPLKIAGAVIAAVIVVMALAAVIGIPSRFLTAAIADRVARETGYTLAIHGGAKIGFSPSLTITLNDVALQDPKARDIKDRLTAERIEAELTPASLWSGRPEIQKLSLLRPVIHVPLQRERDVNPPPRSDRSETGGAFSIDHVSVTDGTLVLFNLHDRVERRIEAISADASISGDREIVVTGSGRSGDQPLQFEIKATTPALPLAQQNIPTELSFEAPGLLQSPLTAKAELRLNGPTVTINNVSGTLGKDTFNGWASVDFSSKLLLKLDLDFQRLTLASSASPDGAASQPWSDAPIDLAMLNYVDAQAKISAAELNIGDGHFAPAAIEAALASGVLKAQLANFGAYDGKANGELTVDVSAGNPSHALRADIDGVRALPLLQAVAGFDRLDGRMQAKIDVHSSGNSQRAIMSNMTGTASAVFKDGAIRGLNVAQMIRSLTSGALSGWQASETQSTDLSQLSASFAIDKGQAATSDLDLVGPLVKMTGSGTVDLGSRQLGFRVEPKLVMTTEGQGRAGNPVGFGIPVRIEGPWDAPRIYPDVQGILDNPEAAYAKLRELGQGLFGPDGGGGGADDRPGQGLLGGELGAAIGDLLQQGLNSFGGGSGGGGSPRPSPRRNVPSPSAPPAQSDPAAPQENHPMNDVPRQLFNR